MKSLEHLESIKKQREELKRKEAEITPTLTDLSHIPTIYNWFVSLGGTDLQKFIFIILLLFDPQVLIGKRMKKGLRKMIAIAVGERSETRISHKTKDVMFLHKVYANFRNEVDYLYSEILFRIEAEL